MPKQRNHNIRKEYFRVHHINSSQMLPQGKWAPLALMTSTEEQRPPSHSWQAPDCWLDESGDELWGRITVSPASDLKISGRSLFNFKESTKYMLKKTEATWQQKVEPPEYDCVPGAGRWEHALGSNKVGVWQGEMKAFSTPPPKTMGGVLSFSATMWPVSYRQGMSIDLCHSEMF